MYNLVMRFFCINQSQKMKEKLKKKVYESFALCIYFL